MKLPASTVLFRGHLPVRVPPIRRNQQPLLVPAERRDLRRHQRTGIPFKKTVKALQNPGETHVPRPRRDPSRVGSVLVRRMSDLLSLGATLLRELRIEGFAENPPQDLGIANVCTRSSAAAGGQQDHQTERKEGQVARASLIVTVAPPLGGEGIGTTTAPTAPSRRNRQ